MGGYVISGVVMSKRSKDSPYVITATIIIAATIFLWSTSALANGSKTKYGITVTECNFDYDEENYCADSRMKAFAKVMEERSANFAGKKAIIFIVWSAWIKRQKKFNHFIGRLPQVSRQ